jgi:two-component system, sensor histidine kinase YesM
MKEEKKSNTIFKSIKTRLTAIFVVTIMLISITSIFVLITSRDLIAKMDDMFSVYVEVKEFMGSMENVDSNLTKYLSLDDSDSLLNYYKYREILIDKSQSTFNATEGIYSQDDLINRDIASMVDSYLSETEAAVTAKVLDDADEYIARYVKASEIKEYINTYVDRLNLSKLDVNTTQYLQMSDNINYMQITNIALIISVIGMNILVIFRMTIDMTKPIDKLAKSAVP